MQLERRIIRTAYYVANSHVSDAVTLQLRARVNDNIKSKLELMISLYRTYATSMFIETHEIPEDYLNVLD